jgi:riboflavin biosynthesis pyrimidine reductase
MRVVSNTAITLDGRINTREGAFTQLGTARDHARMSRLRAGADAVLVGGRTFRNWPHPSLPDAADRPALGDRRPWNVVVSRGLDFALDDAFVREPGVRPLFLVPEAARAAAPAFPCESEGWPGEGADVPVPWILEALERRGVGTLLVEAGGDLLFQFLAAGALDEMNVTLVPRVAGGRAPSLADGPGFDFAAMPRLALVACEPEGDELFLRYAVRA